MKHLIAIIQPHQLPAVKRELQGAGVEHMSCTNILGTVPNQGEMHMVRGVQQEVSFFQKVRLELFISDDDYEPSVEAICKACQSTGSSGKIFVSELKDVVSAGTGARGEAETY
jgi:nitrogen regulatory protein P-II 1